MSKNVIPYDKMLFMGDYPVGVSVWVQRQDQVGTANWALTSRVLSYDETMEIIETENSIYVPA